MAVVDDPIKSLSNILDADERAQNFLETLEELHARLSTLSLRENIPIDVRQMFETAKNVRLYAYFVYRFHQVAELVAYQTLERALKERWNSEIGHLPSIEDADYLYPSLSNLLAEAVSKAWIRNEGFSGRKRRALNALMQERSYAAIEVMKSTGTTQKYIQEISEEEIEERAKSIDVVQLIATHMPTLRNQLAHGSTRLSPTSDLVLQDVCDAINMVFDGTPPARKKGESTMAQPGLHGIFKKHAAALEQKRLELFAMQPVTRDTLSKGVPARGVYLFSESGRHLYVGRSNAIRKRIGRHCRVGASQNMASFAFRLAIEECKVGKATYRKGQGRKEIAKREDVAMAFTAAKKRIRQMQVRYVEESDPIRQTLLEVYVSIVHKTRYNDFDNH